LISLVKQKIITDYPLSKTQTFQKMRHTRDFNELALRAVYAVG
jgi:hypothetical protein